MIQLTPEAKRNIRQRIAKVSKYTEFEKAQRSQLKDLGNQLRRETRAAWAAAPYKRALKRGSVRAAIKRSIRPVIKNLGKASLRLLIGASVRTNPKARLINVLDPGFTPRGAKSRVRGFQIRPRMKARAEQLVKPFGANLRKALAAQIGGYV